MRACVYEYRRAERQWQVAYKATAVDCSCGAGPSPSLQCAAHGPACKFARPQRQRDKLAKQVSGRADQSRLNKKNQAGGLPRQRKSQRTTAPATPSQPSINHGCQSAYLIVGCSLFHRHLMQLVLPATSYMWADGQHSAGTRGIVMVCGRCTGRV